MAHRVLIPSGSNSYFLFGPRGTGKTTLVRALHSRDRPLFVDLLDPSEEDISSRGIRASWRPASGPRHPRPDGRLIRRGAEVPSASRSRPQAPRIGTLEIRPDGVERAGSSGGAPRTCSPGAPTSYQPPSPHPSRARRSLRPRATSSRWDSLPRIHRLDDRARQGPSIPPRLRPHLPEGGDRRRAGPRPTARSVPELPRNGGAGERRRSSTSRRSPARSASTRRRSSPTSRSSRTLSSASSCSRRITPRSGSGSAHPEVLPLRPGGEARARQDPSASSARASERTSSDGLRALRDPRGPPPRRALPGATTGKLLHHPQRDAEIDLVIERPGLPRGYRRDQVDPTGSGRGMRPARAVPPGLRPLRGFPLEPGSPREEAGDVGCFPWQRGLERLGTLSASPMSKNSGVVQVRVINPGLIF